MVLRKACLSHSSTLFLCRVNEFPSLDLGPPLQLNHRIQGAQEARELEKLCSASVAAGTHNPATYPNLNTQEHWMLSKPCKTHFVTAAIASVWRLLSWRRSIFMRPTPKQ